MKVMLILTKPLTLTYAFLCFFFWSTDNNVLKQGKPLNGYKKATILKPMDVATLKKIGKHHNQATINDVVLGLVSVSMKEYMKALGDQSKSINLLIPYSLRQIPKTAEEHRLCNDFSCLCFSLAICDSFEESVGRVKKQTRAMKKSVYPYGVTALTEFIAAMPGIVGQLVMMWCVSKASLLMSNVPGPKGGMVYGGSKCIGFIALAPGLGDLAFGITALSMGDNLYMAIQADTSIIDNPKQIRAIIERNYDELSTLVKDN
jgi:diacylglycerol O-acyltransferase / wax synthase